MITPNDIQDKVFQNAMRGYSKKEVDEFLDEITMDYQKLLDENSNLKRTIEEQKARIQEAKRNENSVMNTLEQAKRLMSDISESAEKRAEVIIKNARLDAQTIMRNAKESVASYTEDAAQLQRKIMSFKARYKQFLQDELDKVDNNVADLFSDLENGYLTSDLDRLLQDHSLDENLAVPEEAPAAAPAPAPAASPVTDETIVMTPAGTGSSTAADAMNDQTVVWDPQLLKNQDAARTAAAQNKAAAPRQEAEPAGTAGISQADAGKAAPAPTPIAADAPAKSVPPAEIPQTPAPQAPPKVNTETVPAAPEKTAAAPEPKRAEAVEPDRGTAGDILKEIDDEIDADKGFLGRRSKKSSEKKKSRADSNATTIVVDEKAIMEELKKK
jgi:DivIVA domain-containing protein